MIRSTPARCMHSRVALRASAPKTDPKFVQCPSSIKQTFPNAYICDNTNGVWYRNYMDCAGDMQNISVVDQYCEWGACPAGIKPGQKCYDTAESQPCTCVGADCKCAPYIPNVKATANVNYNISGSPAGFDRLFDVNIPAQYAFCVRGQTPSTNGLYNVECG